jgi:hypothetical protein
MPATKSLVSRLASTIEALEARLNPRPRVVDTVKFVFVGADARADLDHFRLRATARIGLSCPSATAG